MSVFEGMTDFLSLLVLQKTDQLEGDAIIMHSVSTYKRTILYIEEQRYQKVFTFMDNDRTGKKYTVKFEDDLSCVTVCSQNHYFHPYNDLNEALVIRTKNYMMLKYDRYPL